MIGYVGVHRANDGDVVDVAGGAGEQFADLDAALPVLAAKRRRKRPPRIAALRCTCRFTASGSSHGRRSAMRAGFPDRERILRPCDGPPFMNRWMMRLALPGKCGSRTANGEVPMGAFGTAASWLDPARRLARPRAPKPMPERRRSSRREMRMFSKFMIGPG